MTPMSVNVSTSAQPVTVSIHAMDNLSGASFSEPIEFMFRIGSPSGKQTLWLTNAKFTLTSGTPLNGTWQATITVPQYAESGTWNILSLTLFDVANNSATLSSAGIQNLGIPTALQVTSFPSDTTAPQFISLSFDRIEIDLTQAVNTTVTVNLTARDDLSGVNWIRNVELRLFAWRPVYKPVRQPDSSSWRFRWV